MQHPEFAQRRPIADGGRGVRDEVPHAAGEGAGEVVLRAHAGCTVVDAGEGDGSGDDGGGGDRGDDEGVGDEGCVAGESGGEGALGPGADGSGEEGVCVQVQEGFDREGERGDEGGSGETVGGVSVLSVLGDWEIDVVIMVKGGRMALVATSIGFVF